ncbi:MAG: TIGR00289 family protein [Methanomassiliicoccales archaeon]|nr:MAG: TIGR00289 family protein [Methanomassiliicoccales archaeon]
MDLAALFSGGKDSTYALYLAQQRGWAVKYLVAAVPSEDSFLFHVPNIHLTSLHSEAMGIPLKQFKVSGDEEEELTALRDTLKELDVEGLVTGAIASDYQWSRFNRIGEEIGLKVFSPLWRKDQKRVLEDIISAGFEVIVVGVSAEGLDESWLGRTIDEECLRDLEKVEQDKGINISGEGGEYETLVLNAPNFAKRLEIKDSEKEWDGKRGVLRIGTAVLADR